MDTDKNTILTSLFDEKLDKINRITEKIIGCSYTASNVLGCGFLEKVYENALTHELRKAGLKVIQQREIEKAANLKIGLLMNFGKPRIEIKRIAL